MSRYWSWIDKQRGPRPSNCPHFDAALPMLYGRSSPAFSPSQLTGLVQRFLDANPTYYASTLNGYPILTPEETGTVAVPRGQRCARFDGGSAYCAIGSTISSLGDFTVACWIKPTQYGMIVGGPTNSDYIWLESSTSLVVAAGGAIGFTHGHTFPFNQWAHIALVRSGGVITVYKNGVAGTTTGVNAGPISFALVGQFPAGYAYGGWMQELLIDDEAYSPSEVATLFSTHLPPTSKTPLAFWPLQEESGTIGYDASGNGKHLTLTNITQATFHAADAGVKWSLPNQKGYTLANNLLLSSQAFSTSSPWDNASGSMTFSANAATAPDGTMTAEVCTIGGNALMYQEALSNVTAGRAYTFSIWLRAQSGTVAIGLRNGNSNTSAVVTATTAWQRFSLTFTPAINQAEVGIDQRSVVVPGVSTSGTFELWGAQLEPGSVATPYAATTSTALSNVIIPASLSTPSQDAAGNALGVTGPVCYPATVEVPCVTGDGSAVYCDLGSALIPASADFSLSLWYYHVTNNTTIRNIFAQRNTGAPSGRMSINANQNAAGAGASGSVLFFINGATDVAFVISSALTAGAWHYITFSRVGNVFTGTCTPANGTTLTGTQTQSGITVYTARNTWLLREDSVANNYSDGRISDLRITTGGVTTYFPLQEGPGSSNTNRDLYYCKSDGTSGTVSGAIVNGTVSTIWANRCPYARSFCIDYGGGVAANGAYIPGRIGSSLDAAGNAKTLQAGEQSPYDLIYPNRWAAPALVNVGITASTSWGKTTAVQATSPADTKFRNTTKGTKNFAVRSALTGADLTNAQNYVST